MKINTALHHGGVCRDTRFGYPVWMSWFPWDAVDFVVKKEKPDLIVALSGLIARLGIAAKRLNIPTMLHLHDVAFYEHGGDFEELRDLPSIANSRFTADKYRSAYGIDPAVIYPFVSRERYRTESTRENITFINPHPEKGATLRCRLPVVAPTSPFPLSKDGNCRSNTAAN
jgi:hypothetical protein